MHDAQSREVGSTKNVADVYLAHTAPDGRTQPMTAHAEGCASRAEMFAAAFGFGPEGRAAGLFHDTGKYAPGFQARLRGGAPYEHSSAGMYLFAARAEKSWNPTDILLAYAISGHHAGLPDTGSRADGEDDDTFCAKMCRRANALKDFSAYRTELGDLPVLRPL